MELKFDKISDFPVTSYETLKKESQVEGFRFLIRLEEEWLDGTNNFSKNGEGLYEVRMQDELVAIGGINIDPYYNSEIEGRLRRFYVKKSYRRKGIGKSLVNYLLREHRSYFEKISLYTNDVEASKFYEQCGFQPIFDKFKISHQIS